MHIENKNYYTSVRHCDSLENQYFLEIQLY